MSKSATRTNRFALLVIILAVLSCDSFTEPDTVTPEKFRQSVYYILAGTSAIIDLESVIQNSFLTGTLNVFEKPKRGTLSYATTSMLKYKPGREFRQGEDHFVLSVVNDGKIVAKGTMTIKMKKSTEEFSCALVPVEDKIKLKPGSSSVSTRVLENDWFCDIDKSNVSISIESQPKFGHAIVDNESVIYTPDAAYKGQDELIYKVAISTDESISYGLLSFANTGNITVQEIPGRNFRSVFFLDEDRGFLGTDSGLYKTTNGGTSWNAIISEGFYLGVYFLNDKHGFATFDWDGFMQTKDGGATWKTTHLEKQVGHVVFTSETTGFLGVSDGGDYSEVELLKTEDGGVTWRSVLKDLSVWGYLDVRFLNGTTGYVTTAERVFVTDDAGETWNLLVDHTFIDFYHDTGDNKRFAIFSDDQTKLTTSQDGKTWNTLATFRNGIYAMGFSSSNDIGFALTFDESVPPISDDPYLQPILVVKTDDKGLTWIEQEMGEPLYGSPAHMAVPSDNVAYFVCWKRIIKYSNK